MAADAGGSGAPTASRWWLVGCLLGIALWVGVTVIVGSRYGGPSNPRPGSIAFAVGGAVFFGVVFAVAAVGMRRSQYTSRSELYDRLAVAPVDPSTIRRATRGMYRIGYTYLAFGALVTGLGLAAIGFGDDDGGSWMFTVMIVLIVLWFGYMLFALRRVYTSTDVLFAPLGLHLEEVPSYVVHWFGGTSLSGAMTYGGTRHGRHVSITQEPKQAVTVVQGHVSARKPPKTPAQMATLTGEPAGRWRGVTVEVSADQVAVIRRGNGAGRWFLNDLLLAEAVARE